MLVPISPAAGAQKEEGVGNYDLCARDIMQVEVATILGDLSVTEAARLMLSEGVRSLIIEPRSESDPYAVITYSDIVCKVLAEGRSPDQVIIDEVMTKPLITIPPQMKIRYIAQLLRQTGIGHIPVVDCGELLGIVSMTDLVTEIVARWE